MGATGQELTYVAFGVAAMAVLLLALVALFVRRAGRPEEVDAWAAAYGLTLTDRNRPVVRYYVPLSIVLRVVGGVGGLVLGGMFDGAIGAGTSGGAGFWAWIVAGWTVGALWAERQVRPRAPGRSRAALLTPRTLAQYLPGRLRAAPWVAAGATVLVAVGAAVAGDVGERASALGAVAVAALVAAAVVHLVEERLVARPQPPVAPDLVAADDAVRTSTIHQVAGAGTAFILLLTAAAVDLAADLGSESTVSSAAVPAYAILALWVAAMVFWRYYTYRAWRVRRDLRLDRALATGGRVRPAR